MFIREFLAEVHEGSAELEDCAYNAYQRTLRHFHGFVIRGVFAVRIIQSDNPGIIKNAILFTYKM